MAAQQAPKRSEWTVRLLASAAILALVWSWGGQRQQDLTFEGSVQSINSGKDATSALWGHCHQAILALQVAAKRGGDLGINAQAALDAISREASK